MSDQPTLNDLSPYPDDLSEVTAEGLARYNAALALHEHHLRMKLDGLVDGHAWRRALHNARTGWAVALLLRKLIEHAGSDVAEEVARELWANWDDSQDFAAQLTRWVSDYDIDPAALVAMARDSYDAIQELKRHAPPSSSVVRSGYSEVHPGQSSIPSGGA